MYQNSEVVTFWKIVFINQKQIMFMIIINDDVKTTGETHNCDTYSSVSPGLKWHMEIVNNALYPCSVQSS